MDAIIFLSFELNKKDECYFHEIIISHGTDKSSIIIEFKSNFSNIIPTINY